MLVLNQDSENKCFVCTQIDILKSTTAPIATLGQNIFCTSITVGLQPLIWGPRMFDC